MTEAEEVALDRLLRLAAEGLATVEAEFGCAHSFRTALNNVVDYQDGDGPQHIHCMYHDQAEEIATLAEALGRPIPKSELDD